MTNILYTVLIFPIEQIIQLAYLFIFRIFKSPALSVLGVSVAVSVCTLPLYFMAEKLQNAERDIQKRMKADLDNIKSVFSGDERFMLVSTYYRQNGYHPLYALRSSVSLLIQIPFFIAAYHFLSNLELIKGIPFGPIGDLAKPDSLFTINILPIAMTVINIVSAFIYTKGLAPKEKIQLYAMAAIFLLLLYNSPSGLVLYWTGNNLFSLFKNIIERKAHSRKIVYIILLLILAPACVYVLLFHKGALIKRLLIFCAALVVIAMPLLKTLWKNIKRKITARMVPANPIPRQMPGSVFFLSLTGLFFLLGLYIPASLISSSVEEFSFIAPYSSPLPYIGLTMLQCFGFLLLLISIYFLFDAKVKRILSVLVTVAYAIFLFNTITFTKEYGIMMPDLRFNHFGPLPNMQIAINILLTLLVCLIAIMLLRMKNKITLVSLQVILAVALLSFGAAHTARITKNFNNELFAANSEHEKIFTISKTGENVIVIVLDLAVSAYFPYIIEEKPELSDSYSGFAYYPNTVSPGHYSIHGLPSVFGGYYYTAHSIHKRTDELQANKIYESIQLMPRIFAANGFSVTAENLPYINRKALDNIHNINASYNNSEYTADFIKKYNIEMSDYELLYTNLIRFSFFKSVPAFLHEFVYDHGNYLTTAKLKAENPKYTINNYAFLYNLPEITGTTDENSKQALFIYNELTHAPIFLEPPDYVPSNTITHKKAGLFGDEKSYYVNMAAILLLAKWFDYLKENDAYDNTRIIIASDHGSSLIKQLPYDFQLPNGRWLRYFNSLLLVKDFNSTGELQTNYDFMTSSDVPHIAANGLIENPVNPFTGRELAIEKENGYIVTTSMDFSFHTMKKNTYNISDNEWIHVHTNIFDPANWSMVSP